jgi:Pyridoxamine 5'-phosphate oxidase
MSNFTPELTEDHIAFVEKQPVFFVATAAQGARINLSPKGMDSFRVLSPKQVGYLDVGGSGNETHAHLAADGRITIMFCAFDRPALILRIYGRGRPVLPQDPEWEETARPFALLPGTRQIFLIDVDSVQTSCGWGVPFMTFDAERPTLSKYHRQDDPEQRLKKMRERDRSIDGLPVRPATVLPWRG